MISSPPADDKDVKMGRSIINVVYGGESLEVRGHVRLGLTSSLVVYIRHLLSSDHQV